VDLIIRSYVKDPDQRVDASLGRAIQEANARLHSTALDQGAEGRARWGTTVVAAVVRHNQLWIANVGDSRAYLQRNGQLRQLSRDHTWAADLDDAPSGEWIGRHLITRALGLKPEVKVDLYRPRALQPGDLMLLCTDGLTGPVPDAEISAILARFPPQDAARALVAAANRHGGPDNISVIVVRVGGRRMEVEAPARPLEQLLRRAAWWRWLEDLRALIPVQDTRLAWALLILAALLITLALIMLILVLANVFPSNGPAIVHTWG
jgi:protein phosphatase